MEKALTDWFEKDGLPSGGVISGKDFSCGKKLHYEDCVRKLKEAIKAFDKPFRKRAKAQRLLEASEQFIESLGQVYKHQGADEIVSLFRFVSSPALWAYDTLVFQRAHRFLDDEFRYKDVTNKLFVLSRSDELRYDALYVLK